MSNPFIPFILKHVVADYVRLYKTGNAPAAEHYASAWAEQAETLVPDIFVAEFRLRRENLPTFSIEAFLQDHPSYRTDVDFIIRLLEHELETTDAKPDLETLHRRFPQIDPDRLTDTAELIQLRQEWNSKPTAPVPAASAAAATTDFTSKSNADATVEMQPQASPAATGMWTPERARTIEWSPGDSDEEMDFSLPLVEPDDTMDFQPAADETDFSPEVGEPATINREPATVSPEESEDEEKTFTVRDSLTVENFLGKGFWKDVYKAKQHSTQQFVALKHLRESNEKEMVSLIREVRTQAMLTHQNIPPVFMLDILPSGQAIVVEKLVDGSRWSDTILSRTLDDNLRILLEVAQAVAFAHRRHRIIHRDLKPDNVVINDNYGEVYVIDWGLAADVGDAPSDSDSKVPHVSQLNNIAGTPLYWAPELASGESAKCCPATDVFLLGALLYEILTGCAPYKFCRPHQIEGLSPADVAEIRSLEVGPMLRATRGIIIPPRLFAPNRYIPDELLAIAMKSLSRLPEKRYTDAGDFIDAIKRYQQFSLITRRCDQNWKQFEALRRERDLTLKQPDALLSLTLRFIETSDIFNNIAAELHLRMIAVEADSGVYPPAHPTLLSAQQGEVVARTELIALTLRSGDLTLADAQIGLVERNPFHNTEKTRTLRNQVRALNRSRRRAVMMKWVAVALLAVFLGTSTLYGFLMNEQVKKTVLEYHRAEENFHRAESNFQKAQNAVNEFYTMVAKDDAIKNAGLMPLRLKLLDSARKYHEDFVSQKSDDPDVIAGHVGSLFDMAGLATHFGNRVDAIDYYLRAIELGNELAQKYPKNAQYLDVLAKCYKDLAVVYNQDQFSLKLALDSELKALEINRRLVAEHGSVAEYHRNLARILHNLGMWEMKYGTAEEAEQYFLESLSVRETMTRFTDPPEYHFGKAQTYFALAVLYVNGERFDDADQEFETALQLLDELKTTYPDRFGNDEIDLQGMILYGCGERNFKADRLEVAHSYFSHAIHPFGLLVEKSPEHIGYQRKLNNTMLLIFECLIREGKAEEALAIFQQREESLLETSVLFPDIIQILCIWYFRIAEFHLEQGHKDKAIQYLQNGFEPLDILEDDRTLEEEELWREIRNRLREVLSEHSKD